MDVPQFNDISEDIYVHSKGACLLLHTRFAASDCIPRCDWDTDWEWLLTFLRLGKEEVVAVRPLLQHFLCTHVGMCTHVRLWPQLSVVCK